jgi:hypothetical protein
VTEEKRGSQACDGTSHATSIKGIYKEEGLLDNAAVDARWGKVVETRNVRYLGAGSGR